MRTLLVDDHALVLEGLKHFLCSQGIEVVGTARNGAEALMQYEMLLPDLVLMDIQMAGCDGIQTTRMIKKEYPKAKIVMLSAFEDKKSILAAIQAGAEGYLLKNMEPDSFIRQLAGFAAGDLPLAPDLAQRLLYAFKNGGDSVPSDDTFSSRDLTERQRAVLQLLIQGLTYQEIAIRLTLKESTVKYHIKTMLFKLGLTNRTQLIAYGVSEKMKTEN